MKIKRKRKKRTVRTVKNIKLIRERIRRNCERSARKMGANLNINQEGVRKILREDLKCAGFKKKKFMDLPMQQN